MTNNIIKTGMKKLKIKEKFGRKNIIESIENISSKCIRLGRKRMWITQVPSGGYTGEREGFGTQTWIKNIVSGRRLG
jgi:hypothetical protein